MNFPTRRTFLGGAAAFSAAPALGQVPASGEVDVVIIGAGAAGIAAARRVAAAGRSYALLEAKNRIGGRVFSDRGGFGIPHDRGAHRISASGRNPLVALGRLAELKLYEPAPFRRLYVGTREARDGEYDNFTAALHRAHRAITAAGEAGLDLPATRTLPELADWRATVGFVLGPLWMTKDLDEVSTLDFARAEEQREQLVCRGGMSQLLAAAVRPLALRMETVVTRIDTRGRGFVAVETSQGALRADAVIVTASTNVLNAGSIRFDPALPKRTQDALAGLSLGTYDRLIFQLKGTPFGGGEDQRVVFKKNDHRNIALVGRVGGSDLAYAEFCGRFGREVSDAGDAAMSAALGDLFAEHFGTDARKLIGRTEVARWSREPFVLGGASVASPGSGGSRRALAEPPHERVYFAGEAMHETWFGTVAGAWISGERAADAVLRGLDRAAAAAARPAPQKQRGR